MNELEGKVTFYEGPQDRGKFKGFVRRSPAKFSRPEDAKLIISLLKAAAQNPIARPVDPRKLAKRILFKAERTAGKKRVPAVVTVPEADDQNAEPRVARSISDDATITTRHTEIQCQLLNLGRDMGLDVWVARNDRSRRWNGCALGDMKGIVDELPTQFNEATTRTIELIDVLWLKGNSIVAAFEVECTTSIYSGLLRMSDLLALQPNLEIKLYLVAPDDRRARVQQEILRPTFALRDKPLSDICGFLSFTTLMEKVEGIHQLGIASSLKADFLEQVAEYFSEATAAED